MNNDEFEEPRFLGPMSVKELFAGMKEMDEQRDRAHLRQDSFMQQWRVRVNDLTDRVDGIPEREAFRLFHRMAELQNDFTDLFNGTEDQRSRDLLADFVSGCAEFYRKPFDCSCPRCAAERNTD